ncbi:MAG: FAD binding domain-containing protein [Alphaproteobacteria bacterium]|nr:FAD binding domain-containing protein [Alphaproteobacteria bacterium]MDP6591015.1 FAD binding domain-containing protein [Alphaproteobacteria bacterium]MDP6817216.1 FAD binding domain-containing protein [Alphaproteobacteria bacterium]
MSADMDFLSLTSLAEALEKLRSYGADAVLVAGGTAARYQLVSGMVKAKVALHIERIDGAAGFSGNGTARLGALTTLRDIAEDADILSRFRAVAMAAGKCGGWQTQSIATAGGNVCTAAPTADLLPPLLVQDAEIELQSRARGGRTLGLGEFLLDAFKTARAPDEMATAFLLPAQPARSADTYVRIQRRGAMERPIIAVALRLAMDEGLKNVSEVRIAVSGAGALPFRATEAEALMAGNAPGKEAIRAAADAILARSSFRTDPRASASYRKAVLPRAFAHAVSICSDAIAANGA